MSTATAAQQPTSAAASTGQIVEHVALFKIKPSTPPSTIAAWLASANALSASVPSVLYLVVSPILRTDSPFTHLVHSRYASPAALAGCSAHPEHMAVVRLTDPICEDMMVLDWVSQEPGSVESPIIDPGKAVKVTFLKLKKGLAEEDGKEEGVVADVIDGMKGKVGVRGLEALTIGKNFSPRRAKGFGIGSVAVFAEVEAADKAEVPVGRTGRLEKLVEEVITVSFIVP